MISRAFRSRASACMTAIQRRVSVTRTPFGLFRPGTGYHAQSVLSPPIRSTGDCRGVRLRTSWRNTGSGAFGSVPAYGRIAVFSSDSPRKPGWIAGPPGRRET